MSVSDENSRVTFATMKEEESRTTRYILECISEEHLKEKLTIDGPRECETCCLPGTTAARVKVTDMSDNESVCVKGWFCRLCYKKWVESLVEILRRPK